MIYFISNLEEINTRKFLNRGSVSDEIKQRVREIINNVKNRKLAAILEYTEKFDGIKITKDKIKVTTTEIELAYSKLTNEQLITLRESIKRVKAFHSKQKTSINDVNIKSDGGETTLRWIPIARVGIYAPAGKAPLPSSVLMAAIPARIVGCKEIVLCSPPQKDGNADASILVVANECGIKEIYKIGGAQAIAALAYGCELFDKVDIIAGPGNVYTAYAKQLVSGEGLVKIDTLAGPTEIVIIADKTENWKQETRLIAADIVAQAEHGVNSSSICITTSERLAQGIKTEIEKQLTILPDNEPVALAMKNFGGIFTTNSIASAIKFVNDYAPEHVEIFARNALTLAKKITNAGAIFIRTGEVFGDYGMTGSNHILPTGRAARFASGVSVYTFMKYQFVEELTKKAQISLAKQTAVFARIERLEAHARSAEMRDRKWI